MNNLQSIQEEDLSNENSLENFAQESFNASRRAEANQRPQTGSSSIDLREFPNADFYFKLVAKVNGKYYSIFDGETEYQIGVPLHETAQSNHKGGYYVYPSLKEAVFADVPYNRGGHFIAPRTVLKVIAWGEFVIYGNGKMSFSYIMPVQDLGLPQGYKNSKESIKRAIKEQEERKYKHKEQQWDLGLVRKNQKKTYDNDKFENYFGQSTINEVLGINSLQQPLAITDSNRRGSQIQPVREDIQSGLGQMIADIESRYR